MAAPLSHDPDADSHPPQPFDHSSLEQSLAEALRSATSADAATGEPETPVPEASPTPRADPFRPAAAGREGLGSVNHVGLRRSRPPAPATGAPSIAADEEPSTPPSSPVIPASLRLMAPPPVAPPAPPQPTGLDAGTVDDAAVAGGHGPDQSVAVEATGAAPAALRPWRPEDDDILPVRKPRRGLRR